MYAVRTIGELPAPAPAPASCPGVSTPVLVGVALGGVTLGALGVWCLLKGKR